MSQTLEALVVELRADVKGLQTSLQSAANDVGRFSNQASSNMGGFEAAITRARAAVLSLGVAWAGFRIGRSLVDAGVQLEAMRSKMIAATGNANVAADSLGFVREEANRLGIDVRVAADGFSGFAASALRAGLTLDQTRQIFTGVSEAAVSMRLPAEQTALVFKALEQIAGKGTVSMEELRGQLGDALPGAFEIAAKAMGKTTQEFGKMVANGEVMASDFLPRFGDAVRRELGGSVEEASQGAQAAFNRLSNAFFDMQTQLASSGLLDVVVKSVNQLTNALNDPELVAGLSALISMLAKVLEFALKVAGAMGQMVSSINRAIDSIGSGIFGGLFGEDGLKALEEARKAAEGGKTRIPVRPTVSGDYTLGTISNAEPDSARKARESAAKKAEALRERLRGQVDSMAYGFASPEQQAALDVEKQQETLREALEAKAITEQEFRELSLQAEMDYQERLKDIRDKSREEEQSALESFLGIRFKTQEEMNEASLKDQAQNFRATIAEAAKHNRAFFALEKAAAIARALVAARESVVSAYNFGVRIGGPPLGAAFAGIAAAAQAANIASIASTSFSGGGASGVSSSGSSSSGSTSDTASSSDAGTSAKSVYITLNGDESSLYSKNQIRKLIESINDAVGDGSQLKVAVS